MLTTTDLATEGAPTLPAGLPPDALARIASQYDADYYERGIESGKSLYTSYRWLPEFTLPTAMVIIDALGIRPGERFLDFGCAKGFLVKAMRMLRRDAWGIDISEYAIAQAPEDVRPFVNVCDNLAAYALVERFQYGMAKDVLEHVPYETIDETVYHLSRLCDTLLVAVPLGQSVPPGAPKRFVIEASELDRTHIVREDPAWWCRTLRRHYADVQWRHHVEGIKDHWHKVNPAGNAAFICRRPWCR
ncbi:MAG: class I SAM-dependent methyltransferase [Phycisphaerales bacterium]